MKTYNKDNLFKKWTTYKKDVPGHVVFMRVTGQYMAFGNDAKLLCYAFNLALTAIKFGGNPSAFVGIPEHQIDSYCQRMEDKKILFTLYA